ncbi:MAG: hypothetical protein LJE66_11905, partial [Desulfobacterales bacterium]|nr:hypothetical protein [Desulfobacterales bacterium]
LKSPIYIMIWRMWTVGCTAPICITSPSIPPASGSRVCWLTVLPQIRVPWRDVMNFLVRTGRSIICAGRTFWKVPNACASRSATRIPG